MLLFFFCSFPYLQISISQLHTDLKIVYLLLYNLYHVAWLSWQYCIWKTICHARSRGFLRGGAIQRGEGPNKAGRGKSLGGGEASVVWVIKVATGGAHVECVLIAWVTWGGPGACSPGKVLHLSPLKWLEINIKNKNGVVKLGILSTSKNVAIKKTRLHKTHDTTTTILQTFDLFR